MDAENYINGFIPANYFITKSMELSRVGTSGTLWFTKKFLVYYYYIFLSDNINFKTDVDEICRIFDSYIKSLPSVASTDALDFFYSSHPTANPKNKNFKLFKDFAGHKTFASPREEKQYYSLAKKYYFAFLMETGGQTGVKAAIKEKLYDTTFCFDQVEDIIRKYYDGQDFKMQQVINDYMASLRNERQILYYYGFFHSKSNGATDEEFSSLTPIGELALNSNFYEFVAIWEHQKFKMVSQPVTVQLDTQYLPGKKYDPNNFLVNNNPYYTILRWLQVKGQFSINEYQFLISRLHTPIDTPSDIDALKAQYDAAYKHVQSFKRKREIENEDFRKELLKYTLGLRGDLIKDHSTNPLSVCKLKGSCISVINHGLLSVIVTLYSNLINYKEQKNSTLFSSCEQELRRQYEAREAGKDYVIEGKVKIDWDLYNMHIDIPVILTTMMLVAKGAKGIGTGDKDQIKIADAMYELMPNIIKYCGFTTRASRIKEVANLFNAFKSNDYSSYLATEEEDYCSTISTYLEANSEALLTKLKVESESPSAYKNGKRERNHILISALKAYNTNIYGSTGGLVCECCGHTTFFTTSHEPYLEYHHLIPFNKYEGPDHYLNLYALCPMCHRKMHFLPVSEKRALYGDLSNNNYRHISIPNRLIELKREKRLRSYHLDFLLADNAITEQQYNEIVVGQ